jgi:predicted aldo/keto reductase-like oxidoreductase
MNVFNFADRSNYDFEGLVLPAAKKRNVGVVAMKVLGGAIKWQYDGNTKGVLAEHHEQAIRFSLGVPGVACAVVGFATVDEARKALDVAARFKPLTTAERDELLAAGRKLAVARAGYYGPVDG